jgi:hypothetical protein
MLGTNASACHKSHWAGLQDLGLDDRYVHGLPTWRPPYLARATLQIPAAALS